MRISDWSSDVCSSDLPTYSRERVEKLIEHVHPSGSLLLLRARAPGGESIATGIFAGFGRYSTFWGNGSVTDMLHLRPNQALHWYAMRYWKARGVHLHAWGGDRKSVVLGKSVSVLLDLCVLRFFL